MSKLASAAKTGLVKGVRTFLQTLAGALIALPPVAALTDIKVQGGAILLALYVAAAAGVVAFCQNTAENI